MQSARTIQPQQERVVSNFAKSRSRTNFRRTQELVEAIGRMNWQGNILPAPWFQHPLLRHESGRVNLPAAIILSDVIYWYRPQEIREEATGKIIEYRRKFRADKLQKSYRAWAEQFGMTKRQVKDAVAFLRLRGLVATEFRHVTTESGLALSNVLFIEPVLSRITELNTINLANGEEE